MEKKLKMSSECSIFFDLGSNLRANIISKELMETLEKIVAHISSSAVRIYCLVIYKNFLEFELLKKENIISNQEENFYNFFVEMLELGRTFIINKGYIEFHGSGKAYHI